jgi:hypothetical protein
MPDKSQWSKYTHGFFMHCRPKTERYKGNGEKTKRKGHTSALFVRTLGVIGITARGADQKTLKL